MPDYRDSGVIYRNINNFERESYKGFNGFILLCYIGTALERKDKFYHHPEFLIRELKIRGYQFKRTNELLDFY